MSHDAKSPQFMFLLRHPPGRPGEAQLHEIMAKFAVWMQGLAERGEVAGGNGLQHTGAILRGAGGVEVTDGPFAEAKEIVGGYIMINAPDLPAAIAIARGCPGLAYGLAVEVRPIESHASS